MTEYDLSPLSLILVAIMPEPQDLHYARMLGWYRIPVRSAPRVLNVDYLAFYQPGSFQSRRWRVEHLAPVRGHELTTRQELLREQPDHPRADEEYFKVQLGPLKQLKKPILAGSWKRFTFLYTTGEYFLRARTLTDLTVAPAERRKLWRALRERQETGSEYGLPEEMEQLPDRVIAVLLGINSDPGKSIPG